MLWPASIAALVLALRLMTPVNPPEYVVLAAPGAPEKEVQAIWELFSVPPTPTQDTYNPEGIRSVSATYEGEASGVRVTFHPGSNPAGRAAVMARAIASPLVAVVREYDGKGDSKTQVRVLKGAR